MIRQSTLSALSSYTTKGKLAALSAPTSKQLAVFNVRAWNRTGGAINVGLCKLFASGKRKLFTKVVSTYTEVTAALLAAGQVVANTTADDGFVVQADRKFNLIGFTVSNSATGGTYVFEYWDGSAWATLVAIENPTDLGSTGDKWIVFLSPVDWAAGGSTGLDQSMYSIRVTHSVAPGDTGAINAVWVAEMLDYVKALGDGNSMQVICDSDRPILLEAGEGLMPFFSTANNANAFGAFYSTV